VMVSHWMLQNLELHAATRNTKSAPRYGALCLQTLKFSG
jgi:hypothetical protein